MIETRTAAAPIELTAYAEAWAYWRDLDGSGRFRALIEGNGGRVEYAPTSWKRYLVRASEIRERPVRWLWRDRIPRRTTTLITGVGGLAKSQSLLHIVGELTRGELTGRPESVIYFSAEDDPESVLAPRMRAAGVDQELVYTVRVGWDFLLREDGFGALEASLRELHPAVVVFDPLVAYLDRGTDSWKTQDVRLVLRRLQELASSHDVTFLAVVHFKKSQERNVLHQIAGSAGFGDACRSALAAAPDPEDDSRFVLAHVKCNYGPEQPVLRYHVEPAEWPSEDGELIRTSRVVFDGEDPSLTKADVFEGKPGPEPDTEGRAQAEEFLRSWLPSGQWVDASDVQKAAKEAGISARMLRGAREAVGVTVEAARGSDGRVTGWRWKLAEWEF